MYILILSWSIISSFGLLTTYSIRHIFISTFLPLISVLPLKVYRILAFPFLLSIVVVKGIDNLVPGRAVISIQTILVSFCLPIIIIAFFLISLYFFPVLSLTQ